jgi:protein-L-isoaspartate(D-aspartate) O-methyltransferase
VLDLIARAPREDYVPAAFRNLAFVDMEIPIGHGQVMMAPKLEARLLQALEIGSKDKILEVGTGSGYLTSLLAALGGQVISVEIDADFSREAAAKLAAHGVKNVTLEVGDAANGWDKHAPYDVIVLTGSVPALPEALRANLAAGGRLFAVVGESPVMEARLIRRLGANEWSDTALFETDLPRLVNVKPTPKFVF